jgi:hypothetical protein
VEPGWVPPGIDTGKANTARVYDYWLGGSNNFLADQDAARAMLAVDPSLRAAVRANRAFLGRAVRYLAGQAGIRQFLDIGSGIPTERNVHEVAQEIAPDSRVVYVDSDEVAVAHSRLLLQDNPAATVIQADLREPEKILADPATQMLLDLSRPVTLLLVAVLHFIPDEEDPWRIVARLRDALAPGSYLVLCQACSEAKPELASATMKAYEGRVAARSALRSRADIRRFFDGFDLIEPGLVYLPEWRPDSPDDVPEDPEKFWGLVGVARRG